MPLITALAGSQGSECGISLNNQDCRIKTRRQEQRGHAAAICAAAVVGGSGRGGCAGGARPPAPRAPGSATATPRPTLAPGGTAPKKSPNSPPQGLVALLFAQPSFQLRDLADSCGPFVFGDCLPATKPAACLQRSVTRGVTACHRSAGSDWHLVTRRGGGHGRGSALGSPGAAAPRLKAPFGKGLLLQGNSGGRVRPSWVCLALESSRFL